MRKALLTILLSATSFFVSWAQAAKEIAKKSLGSTVAIIMQDKYKQTLSLGSGFILENGMIATNYHVIEGASYGYVIKTDGDTKYAIEGYFSADKNSDLALLSVPQLFGTPLTLSDTTEPEIGERIYVIGNPKGLTGTISEGIVSGLREFGSSKLIQITAPISPGSSGGPVITNDNKVIGVAVGTLVSGQNLNFAIPIKYLKLLISQKGIIKKLDIPTAAANINETTVDIKEGVTIRNLKWGVPVFWDDYIKQTDYVLNTFSIKNELPYYVCGIKILYIRYDSKGVPIDSDEQTFCDCKEGYSKDWMEENKENIAIRPFLAKTFAPTPGEFSQVNHWAKSYGEKVELRILDFEIIEE